MYTPFEKRRIRDLVELFPDLAPRLKPILDRLVDLKPIVKDHYYHPDMKGSRSLKSVTACIAPEMSHANLEEVTDGMAAQRAYSEIIAPETNDVRREDLKKKLLDYCALDTLAMVRIAVTGHLSLFGSNSRRLQSAMVTAESPCRVRETGALGYSSILAFDAKARYQYSLQPTGLACRLHS
jgi:hypothetical protein